MGVFYLLSQRRCFIFDRSNCQFVAHMILSWLTNCALVYEPNAEGGIMGDAGSQPTTIYFVSDNEYSCAQGAQINYGDLTSCLTYGLDTMVVGRSVFLSLTVNRLNSSEIRRIFAVNLLVGFSPSFCRFSGKQNNLLSGCCLCDPSVEDPYPAVLMQQPITRPCRLSTGKNSFNVESTFISFLYLLKTEYKII
jgi:hypothetical protein